MLTISEKKLNREEIKNKRVLSSFTMWEKSEASLAGNSMDVHQLKEELKRRYIHVKCEEDEYIDIEKIRGKWIQISGSSDDNRSEGKFHLIIQKTNELYIDLTYGLIDMVDFDMLRKDFIIKTVNKVQNKVTYYGLSVNVEIKQDEDEKRNKIDTLDVKVYLHELKTINLLMNTISIAFYSMLIYFIINIIQKKFNLGSIDYALIGVILTYFGQLVLRTVYLKNTFINRFAWWIKRLFKKTTYDPFKFNLREYKRRLTSANKSFNENQKR